MKLNKILNFLYKEHNYVCYKKQTDKQKSTEALTLTLNSVNKFTQF